MINADGGLVPPAVLLGGSMTTGVLTAPGPAGDRFIGNLGDFSASPLEFLTECVRTYGDVVMLGSHNVLLAHPDDIERVLVDRDSAFVKTTNKTLLHTRKQGFPGAMMNSDGEDWHAKRRRLSPAFTRRMVDAAALVAREEADRAFASWRGGQTVEPDHDLSVLTLRTITRLMFGDAIGQADIDTIGRLVAVIMDFSEQQIMLPQWFPTPRGLRLRRSLREIDELLTRIMRTAPADSPVLEVLRGSGLSDSDVQDELATLLLAGFETSKNAITWACHLLAGHPDVADRVAADPSYADRVVREVLRLYPTTWITSREAARDVEFQGHHVPAGTTVTVCQWVTHRDERWFAGAAEFRPDRWEDGLAARGAYFPFGLGPRACIGGAVATTEIVVAVSEICRRFRLHAAGDVTVRPALALQARGARFRLEARG